MDDTNTQQSKKTVVAFVAGLIIGGLLVWMFSGTQKASAPVTTSGDETATTTGEKSGANKAGTTTEKINATSTEKIASTTMMKEPAKGDFTFSVANQKVGMFVQLEDNVQYPTKEGWIAVQDDMNGKLGNVLGAARYNTDVGLAPQQTELLRSTIAGKPYHVVYYSGNGDHIFSRTQDNPLKTSSGGVIETTFVAGEGGKRSNKIKKKIEI